MTRAEAEKNALAAARVNRDVVTVITQTLVDRYDPALNLVYWSTAQAKPKASVPPSR